jgi:flagellar hook protein FlgE
MSVKSILVAAALVVSPQLYAGHVYQLSPEPLTINQCPITVTDNPFDLALIGPGYFVVSRGKQVSEHLFTRFGKLYLDSNSYLRTDAGDYLLAVSKKSDPNHLSKIKIPVKNLAPKATSHINLTINLPATAPKNEEVQGSLSIYDSLSIAHVVTIKYQKKEGSKWSARVLVDNSERAEGALTFNAEGVLSKQEGLDHIQWPADYGIHELKINFDSSTQYGSPYAIYLVKQDGYPLGTLVGVDISWDGEFQLVYTNGQLRILKNRIAVALFTNPSYLEYVSNHLYKPTEKSGQPRIHWVNSEHAIYTGGLEQEPCLIN